MFRDRISKKAFSLGWIILIVFVVLLIAEGIVYFLVQEKSTPSPKSESVEKSKQVEKTSGMENCGSTAVLSEIGEIKGEELKKETVKKLDNDKALSCFGNNILNNCRKSSVEIVSKEKQEKGKIKLIIKGKDEEGRCNVRMQFGNKDELPSDYDDKYANTYLTCHIKSDMLQESNKDIKKHPGKLAFGVFFSMSMRAAFPSDQGNCDGTLLEKAESQQRK